MRSEKQIFLYYTVRIAVTSPSFVDTLASRFTLDCVMPRSAEYLQTPGTAVCGATVSKLHTVPQLGMAGAVTGTHRPLPDELEASPAGSRSDDYVLAFL